MVTKSFINRNRGPLALLSIVVAVLLVGCGATSSSPPASPSASHAITASATLKPVPTGTAALRWDPNTHMLTVTLSLTGLAPNSVHPFHIYEGSCGTQGRVVYPLQTVVANAYGTATVTSTVPNVTQGIPASGWFINVHNGPGLSPADQFLPIVCGVVSNAHAATGAVQVVSVPMNIAPMVSTGEPTQGMAHLTLSGETLTVQLTMSGLVPNSSHPAHIHSGSCAQQGPVVYPLTTMVADAAGNARATTIIKHVSAIPSHGWYIHVHRGPGLSTQTDFDPIACGNVIVG